MINMLRVIMDKVDSMKEQMGRDREGDARGRGYGDVCICIADSFCSKAETNTPL